MTWALVVSWLALVAAAIYLDRLAERGMEALGREEVPIGREE